MTFSSYLSFASLYEIEQRQALHSRAIASDRGVLRRDSSSSSSSTSSSSSARVHFLNEHSASSDSFSSAASSSSSRINEYASHSARLHSSSKRYSTSDGSLPRALCPYDLCSSSKTCKQCRGQIEEQDLSLKRFSR